MLRVLKARIKGVLAGHAVAMETCYIKRINATCEPMIGFLCDTITVASLVEQW